MNVFFLAFILKCVSEIVCVEMSRAMCRSLGRTENESKSCHVVLSNVSKAVRVKNEQVFNQIKRERKKAFKGTDYIGNHITSPAPNSIFIRSGQNGNVHT